MQKYKTVNNGRATVDESLFGVTRGNQIKQAKRSVKPLILAGSSAVVISADELLRLKQNASIKSDEEINAEMRAFQQSKEERERKAKERKVRMRELERQTALKAVKSDFDVENDVRDETLRALAADKLDKQHDVVKLLESMQARAVAFTLRDQQIKEKEKYKSAEAEYDRRMDIIMEIDRLKDLQRREQDEAAKREKRVEDRRVISEQIALKQKSKIIQAEAREQENLAMRATMKKYEEDDEKARALHRQEVERSRLEFVQTNAEAIRKKQEHKEQEKREVQDILLYQAMKDAEMLKREEEEAAIERKKKERQAELLAQQERVQSNAGKLDELRARRAEEERERKYRQREREQAEKSKREMQILVEARIQQAAEKATAKEREQLLWKEQCKNDLEYNRRLQEREEREQQARREKSVQHRNNVLAAIEERKRAKEMDRIYMGDEGTRYRQERVAEIAKLSTIRDKMVRDLENKGVNTKYLAEMKAVDINKMVNR